jgi:hypothetical protein
MDQLKHVIEVWTGYAQGLTGSIGALAFVCAFIWMIARLDEFFISVNGQSLRIPCGGRRLLCKHRFAGSITDPDGNRVQIGQPG